MTESEERLKRAIDERQAVEDRGREGARLADLSSAVCIALTETPALEIALGRCANAMIDHLGAAVSRIWTVGDDDATLELKASAGLDGELSPVIDDRTTTPDWVARNGLHGVAGYPLLIDDRLVGVMTILTPKPLSATAIASLAIVARQLALAIERTKAETIRRKNELRFQLAVQAARIAPVDITETEQMEAQLAQSQKMDVLARFAGSVAHDFNNMLTAILGYAALVKDKLPPQSVERGEVEEIENAGTRASDLTQQLLAFSRNQVLQPRVLELNLVVQDASRMLQRLIGEHIQIATRLDEALGKVLADPGQIHQILMNLAVNARDAMPQGGILTIETANVDLTEQRHRHGLVAAGPYVMTAVSDNGTGMSEETQRRLFEPFFTTKGIGKGTGLGLATVYGIVKQSHGYIRVYSELGKGTTFKIYLPRADEEAVEEIPNEDSVSTPAPVAAPRTVLLVENEQSVRKLTRTVLERAGYRVLEAEGPATAVEIAARHDEPIALLLTDVVMPGGRGTELHARLAGDRPDLRVLFISGFTDGAIVRHGVLGADAPFLQKPFTPKSLLLKVREILDAGEEGVG